ncbi:hypothetical protein HAX54_049717, partial [Datura stramonium]|nr:hypothetical protein [Datura stramonium]
PPSAIKILTQCPLVVDLSSYFLAASQSALSVASSPDLAPITNTTSAKNASYAAPTKETNSILPMYPHHRPHLVFSMNQPALRKHQILGMA